MHKILLFAVFNLSLKLSFCFWSHSFSSLKMFSLKPEINCSAGMWDVQEYQAWATGHFHPSSSVLIFSVYYETSYITMDFLEEWLEIKVNSVCFPNVVTRYQTISLLIILIDRSDEIFFLEKWFQVLTWNVFRNQGFLKIDPSGVLRLIVFSCLPDQAVCSFSSLPDSHNICQKWLL